MGGSPALEGRDEGRFAGDGMEFREDEKVMSTGCELWSLGTG